MLSNHIGYIGRFSYYYSKLFLFNKVNGKNDPYDPYMSMDMDYQDIGVKDLFRVQIRKKHPCNGCPFHASPPLRFV